MNKIKKPGEELGEKTTAKPCKSLGKLLKWLKFECEGFFLSLLIFLLNEDRSGNGDNNKYWDLMKYFTSEEIVGWYLESEKNVKWCSKITKIKHLDKPGKSVWSFYNYNNFYSEHISYEATLVQVRLCFSPVCQ